MAEEKKEKIIRTKDRIEGGITPEEKVKLEAHVQQWIAIAMRTGRTDPHELEEAIKDLYKAADLEEPVVAVVPSPIQVAFAGTVACAWWACSGRKHEDIKADMAKVAADTSPGADVYRSMVLAVARSIGLAL